MTPTPLSDPVLDSYASTRSPEWLVIYKAVRSFQMGNITDEDGDAYPLVDLMSNDPPSGIETGEEQIVFLSDEIVEALEAARQLEALRAGEKDAGLVDN